ncbi:MAG: sulfite exporter TauE/SafE family protein [Chloroflexota bacterium]|nr:sulfite exporter TauE/SafE family protein [Chloroflexota bacterium]
MTPELLLIAVIVFFAILTQAVSGFGLALVAMPLFVQFLDPVEAASLVALMATTTQIIMLLRYGRALKLGGLWRLMLGSLVGIPIGVILLAQLDSEIILFALGVILVSYSLYSLFAPPIPIIKNANWGYLFGFASGLLGGAYNTGGPPFVIYGASQRWETSVFKANLQVLLMVNSVSVVIAHVLAGHYTEIVVRDYAIALPMIVLGALAGFWLDRYINETLYRRIILVLLLIIGVRLLVG